MELLNNLGINGKLLLAQIINFVILLAVLYKFAYGPVLKMLNDRTKKIEKGLKDAEEAKKKLIEMEKKEKNVLHQARLEAKDIIEKAEAVSVKDAERIIAEAKDQSEKMLDQAKRQIEKEKEKILAEAKSEIANLVMVATEKIIGEKLDENKDRELINSVIK